MTAGRTIQVRLDQALPYQLDGGDRKKTKKLKIKVKAGAISVAVPERGSR
jgi:diacylglycerol kinase family enzyme